MNGECTGQRTTASLGSRSAVLVGKIIVKAVQRDGGDLPRCTDQQFTLRMGIRPEICRRPGGRLEWIDELVVAAGRSVQLLCLNPQAEARAAVLADEPPLPVGATLVAFLCLGELSQED